MRDTMAIAMHESGHAWAFYMHRLPLRYITVRPRTPGVTGVCRPWKPPLIGIGIGASIARAGPIAEAMCDQDTAPEGDDWLEWRDYLVGAVLAGSAARSSPATQPLANGQDDLSLSIGMLDNLKIVEMI